jgi:hypothetical protein
MTDARLRVLLDPPLTELELELIDALAEWQAELDFARLMATAPRPGSLDLGASVSDIPTVSAQAEAHRKGPTSDHSD